MSKQMFRLAMMAAVLTGTCVATAAQTDTQNTERLQQAWRTAIAHKAVPAAGCFTASYPVVAWRQVKCVNAALNPLMNGAGPHGSGPTGGLDDYAADTRVLTSSATGSFPVAKRLRWEKDGGTRNFYSLQLNSNHILNERRCAHASTPSICYGWQQFVYQSIFSGPHDGLVFIQNWLVFYNPTADHPCPKGWGSPGLGNCVINSALIPAPNQPIAELPHMTVTGSAVAGGLDTVVVTTQTQAYSTTQTDKQLFLGKNWNASEFNVFGGGGGTEADFNPGTMLTVQVDVDDHGRRPTCASGAGGSEETTNMTLGTNCKTKKANGPALPYIQFVERATK